MGSAIEKNYFKSFYLLILLALFISCKTTLKANDVNTIDLDSFAANEKPENPFLFEWRQHTVLTGDSISEIAQNYGISPDVIIATNKHIDTNSLQNGMILRIPNMDGILYQFKENDSFAEISSEYKVPLELILEVNEVNYNNIKYGEIIFLPVTHIVKNEIEPEETSLQEPQKSHNDFFIYPVETPTISGYFGNRNNPITGVRHFHDGIDYSVRIGETVMASMEGIVSIAVFHKQHGNYIVINHSNGYKTLYSHLSLILVNEGDTVKQGQKIGESGNTGFSTGPHLHFSIYNDEGAAINPLGILRREIRSGE